MLTQLQIQNFKGWKDTGLIRMAPITLFFGANSSGKSSIGQFLMLLKQTVESQDAKRCCFLVARLPQFNWAHTAKWFSVGTQILLSSLVMNGHFRPNCRLLIR